MATTDDRYQLACDLFNLKQYGDAARTARAELESSPDDGRLWQVLGASLWHLGREAEAGHALETASALAPLRPLAQRLLAERYARQGKPALAVMMFRHLLDSRRCPTELLPGIAASLNGLRQFGLALRACRILTRREPERHQAHFATAFYLNRLGAHPRRLMEPLTHAMRLAPHLLHYRLNLAFVSMQVGRFAPARELIATIDPTRVFCAAWLQRMQAIFEKSGDAAGMKKCTVQLQRIRCGRCDNE